MIDLGQRPDDLDRKAGTVGKSQHAQMRVLHVCVHEEAAASGAGNRDDPVVDRKRDGLPRREKGPSVRPDELRIAGCGSQLRLRGGEMVEIVQRRVGELGGGRPERTVDRGDQLSADDEIDHERGDDDSERNGRCCNERQTCAEAHRPALGQGDAAGQTRHGSLRLSKSKANAVHGSRSA